MLKPFMLLPFLLLGCGGPAMTQAEFDAADFGGKLYPSRAEKIVEGYFSSTLRDPASVQYKDMSLHKTYERLGSKWVFGYVICVSVNAKNAFGGYVGYKRYGLFTRNEKLLEVSSDDQNTRLPWIDSTCKAR